MSLDFFASDGCLANNGRHLILTSKDYELIGYTQNILNTFTKVHIKYGQFNTPAKSKTIAKVNVPDEYFPDFLLGYFDGDCTVYGYQDMRWRSSFMYYCGFVSASPEFLFWLQSTNQHLLNVGYGSIHK